MKQEKLNRIFERMLELYVKCLRLSIAERLSRAWQDEEDGWYAHFLEIDRESAAKANVSPIAAEVSHMGEFDLQACNKSLYYLKPVRDAVYAPLGLSKATLSRLTPYYLALIDFRNNYVGHENYTEEQTEKFREEHDKAVEKMHLILQTVFSGVADPENKDGQTFFEQFEVCRLQYKNAAHTQAYYLADYLDLTQYDASKFLPICKKLGIDTDVIDDKYIFYTHNLEETLALLRNFMAKNGDGQVPPAVQTVTPPTVHVQVPPDNQKQGWRIVLIVMGILLAMALTWGILSAISDFDETVFGTTAPSGMQTTSSTSGQTTLPVGTSNNEPTTTTTTTAAATTVNSQTNQIPAQYEPQVQALQYASEGRIHLMTINLKVGGYASPPAAATWTDGVIYSQNTNVAVGEGVLIRGVSAGETYIAFESGGLAIIYRVVVS